MNQSEINDLLERNPNAASETECARLRSQRDRLREACKNLLEYAVDHLADHRREFGETERNARYHTAVQADIDNATAALKEAE